jgi:tetratricopeptide (TPR) repeat protein
MRKGYYLRRRLWRIFPCGFLSFVPAQGPQLNEQAMPLSTDHVKVPFETHAAQYFLLLLLTICFCLSTDLGAWFQTWQGNRSESANLMAVAMGDARRIFANHFFIKADAYFHSGFYPSVYDNLQSYKTPHIAEDSGAMKSKNTGDETTFLGRPRNWIDRFGRQFFPSVHTHLTDGGANGQENQSEVREILPWMKLSCELDPKRVETYTVTAYWLRAMGRPDEAEDFLREGLKENPGNPQLLFDLGRLFLESRKDAVHARNVWEAGLRNLERAPDKDKEANKFVEEQTLAALAKLEEQANNRQKAVALLKRLKALSPNPEAIQNWIDNLKPEPNRNPIQ